jgi:hypothetical protein
MSRLSTSLAVALLLGACDSGGGDAPKKRSIVAANPHVEQLKSLSDVNRGLGLRRAVRDSGQRCKKAETSGYQEDYKNLSLGRSAAATANMASSSLPAATSRSAPAAT